jgi:hypothetical protein
MIVQTLKPQIMMSNGGGGTILLVPSTGMCRSNSDTMSTASTTCTTSCAVEPTTVQRKSSLRQQSLSSSSSVSSSTKKTTKSKKQPAKSLPKRKCVRFAPQLEVVLAHVMHRKDMTDQDIDDRFLMQKDVMAIRAHAKLTTKYYRLKDSHMMKRLDACFDQTTDSWTNMSDTTTLRRCVDLVDRTAIDEWCGRLKFHGRGLERYCSEHQRTVRARTIAYARQRTVQKQEYNYDDDNNDGGNQITAEELAAVYRKWTRTATVFALVMALGDQRAARDGDVPPPAPVSDQYIGNSSCNNKINSNNTNSNGDDDEDANNNNTIDKNNNKRVVIDIDHVDDDRLTETDRIALPVVAATTTDHTSSSSSSMTLSPRKQSSMILSPRKLSPPDKQQQQQQHVLPRRKPSLLRRFKSMGAA